MTHTSGPFDRALRERARAVVPGGMYGHLATERNGLPANFPQFFSRGEGARLWDVDGRSYIDFMCAWGPMVLGYGWEPARVAVAEQASRGDCLNGPAPVMVELGELVVDTVAHADWAMFAKNGNDATSLAVRLSRAATGRSKLLKARKAYHGADAAFTPILGGVTAEDRANIVEFDYNDLASLQAAAAEHDGDIAAVIVTPLQHDGFVDQDFVDPEFAQGVRALCDRIGAVLILDEVRTAMRIDLRGAWEPIGVRPDLTCLSKAVANGEPLSIVAGVDALRESVEKIFVTGSFWMSAAPMAAAVVAIAHMRENDTIAHMAAMGDRFRGGLARQAADAGVRVSLTGFSQMPQLRFVDDDARLSLATRFCAEAATRGVYLHPWHNGFLSAAHTPELIDEALEATAPAFDVVKSLLDAP